MRMFYKSLKEVSLLIAGSLLGIVFMPSQERIYKYLTILVIAIVLLILFSIGLLEWLHGLGIYLRYEINKRFKRICIYASYDIDSHNSSWVEVTNRQIIGEFKRTKIRYSIIKSDRLLNRFSVVINPYGGVYPEKDLSTLESLNAIFDYVRKGGIYINIADIPFYYAYDMYLNRRIDTTPLAGDFTTMRSFLQSMLTKKLHVFVYNTGKDIENEIARIINVPSNGINLFEKDIPVDGGSYSPRLAIPYGKGYFIFSTSTVKKENLEIITKLIKKAFELM